MKIAMIGQKGAPTRFGGVERHVEKLSLRLGSLGHDVTVYTRCWYALEDLDFASGVKVVATPSVKTKHLDTITHTFTSTIHAIRHKADVIHYHGVGPALLSWMPRVFSPGTRVVVTFHSIDREHQKWGAFARFALGLGERAACRFPHEVIAVSRGLQEYCRARYGCEASYLPNGVDVLKNEPGAEFLEQYGLSEGHYFVSTGRLIPVKGFHHLIRAFLSLKRRGKSGGMKLAIVGGASYSEDYVRCLNKLARGDKDIVFTGVVSGEPLESLIAHSHSAVQASLVEGLSLSVLEAMAAGKAVVASDIPGNREALGEHGLFFPPGDVKALSQRLEEIISDRTLSGRLGQGSREHVMAHYDWDEIAEATVVLYKDLHPRRPTSKLRGLVALGILGVAALIVYMVIVDKE